MGSWWIASLLSLAHAEPMYLESEPVATREDAERIAAAAAEAGCPGSVTRRYVRGEGWRFFFRSESVEEAAALASCATEGRLPGGVRWVDATADRSRGGAPRSGTAIEPEAQAPPPFVSPWTVEEVLSRLVRAHDGASGGPNASRSLLFRFVRSTPSGGRIEHTYARRMEDRYVAVVVQEGEGVSSRSGIAAGIPWLEGSTTVFPVEQARAQLERFAPSAVLQLAGTLATGTLDIAERPLLRVQAIHRAGDVEWVEVGTEGDRSTAPLTLQIDTGTWRLRSVLRGWEGAQVRWDYEGWVETEDGALRPARVAVSRGERILDVVDITELELSPTLPEEWFRPPAP